MIHTIEGRHDHSSMDHSSMDHSSMDHSSMDHSAHGHSHDMGHNHSDMNMAAAAQPMCKMDMYWNWYTIDACFLSKQWHITSAGMFAGSCIGIVLLVVSVEGLRRLARELDRYIVRDWKKRAAAAAAGVDISVPSEAIAVPASAANPSTCCDTEKDSSIDITDKPASNVVAPAPIMSNKKPIALLSRFCPYPTTSSLTPRPTFLQQLLKSLIYALLIGVSYILMLLAMYYNGYIFFCLIIGAWLGNFLFGWDTCVLDESVAGAERGCGC